MMQPSIIITEPERYFIRCEPCEEPGVWLVVGGVWRDGRMSTGLPTVLLSYDLTLGEDTLQSRHALRHHTHSQTVTTPGQNYNIE